MALQCGPTTNTHLLPTTYFILWPRQRGNAPRRIPTLSRPPDYIWDDLCQTSPIKILGCRCGWLKQRQRVAIGRMHAEDRPERPRLNRRGLDPLTCDDVAPAR